MPGSPLSQKDNSASWLCTNSSSITFRVRALALAARSVAMGETVFVSAADTVVDHRLQTSVAAQRSMPNGRASRGIRRRIMAVTS
jgi:hypothetical protein